MTFAEQIKAHRKRIGLTQAGAAELLEVSKRTVEEWEGGKEPLKVAQEGALARLAKVKSKRTLAP